MMTDLRLLYNLSELDSEIDTRRKSIHSIEEALADDHLLVNAQRLVDKIKAALRKRELLKNDIELIVGSYQAKGALLESKLYGGTVKIPRELEDMQQELNSLRRQQSEEENKLFSVLEEIEQIEKMFSDKSDALNRIKAERDKECNRLEAEKGSLLDDCSHLENERKDLAFKFDTADLEMYNSVRQSRNGAVVAKVENGVCRGCRIMLPTSVVQKAKGSGRPERCPSCSRILYVG